MRIKEVARSGAIFERAGEARGIQGGMQWLAAPGLMLCAYGRVEGLSRGGEETHSCVQKRTVSASLYTRYSQCGVVNCLSVTYRHICNHHMNVTDMTVTIINCYRNKGLPEWEFV